MPATVSMYRFESESKTFWLTFLAESVIRPNTQARRFFFPHEVRSSEAKLGAVVTGYVLPCNRV